MVKHEFLQSILSKLEKPDNKSLSLSMADVHHKGMFSLVIDGTEFGKLTRVFFADKKLKPYAVQLHTHRYPIRLTTIKGDIKHYVAKQCESVSAESTQLSLFKYQSPLNGGSGLSYLAEANVIINDYSLPIGATLNMTTEEFHSVSCSKGSIWIVEELGFEEESSRVLGVPFITEGLYNFPKSFQVNDKFQLLKSEISKMLWDYKKVI